MVFTAGADVILHKFKDFKSRVVFSAEGFCWPDETLAVSDLSIESGCLNECIVYINGLLNNLSLPLQSKYPRVGLGKRFLNSGGRKCDIHVYC